MTVEEMRAASDRASALAAGESDAIKSGVYQQAAFTYYQYAALCERMDAQNALLERIAAAVEAGAKVMVDQYAGDEAAVEAEMLRRQEDTT